MRALTRPAAWLNLLEVFPVSEELEKFGRTLGRILRRDGCDVGAELLKSGLARPYTGGA